jgi:holo-[acyl-carrier protein] synthase
MILGVGTDIVNIKRVRDIYLKFPDLFAKKMLSNQELKAYTALNDDKKVHYLAKRFAAKEAIAKAIGVGIGSIGLKNISILNNNLGKPYVTIPSYMANRYFLLTDETILRIEISLSDEKNYAIAFVVIWKDA